MSFADLIALMPLIILAITPIAVMLVVAVHRSHSITAVLTAIGLAGALISLPLTSSPETGQVTMLLIVDGFARFYIGLLVAAGFVAVLLSYGYLQTYEGHCEEYYILMLLAVLGSAVIVASSHFASFFLGLEILSISLYALIAYPRLKAMDIEAGLKYLVLAATSAAFLVFGMALIYAALGTMELTRPATFIYSAAAESPSLLLMTGLIMLLVGIGFKLAVVPFHLWTPDVYQGAPAPVTAFVATVSKGSLVGLIVRLFGQVDIAALGSLFTVFTVIVVSSMIFGNILALLQKNVKRLLAYSSIAHLGYLLVAFLAGGSIGPTAVTFYLIAYFVMTLGAFGVITVLSGPQKEAEYIDDYRGLFWRRPWLGGTFTAMLLSLAGIPLTVGFIGKFYLVVAGVSASFWLLVIVLVMTSGIGLFYYLRVVVAIFARPPQTNTPKVTLPLAGELTLAGLTVMLVGIGLLPSPLLEIIRNMIA
ncbi:MAG: NADH-quinone oxidoreductase subunit N [Desulfobacterales bacterium]